MREPFRPTGLRLAGFRRLLVPAVGLALVLLGAHPAAAQARIVYLQGAASLTREGQQHEAAVGMPCDLNDVIQTGPDGFVIISLDPDTEVKIRENTSLALESLGEQTTVNLSSGGIFARVSRQILGVARQMVGGFTVKADNVIAGVRGTEFFVTYGRTIDRRPDIWLCVNSGSVEVMIEGTDQSTVVEEGEGINILGGARLTEPKFYPWTEELNWNTDPRRGEVVDRTDIDQAYTDLLDQDYN